MKKMLYSMILLLAVACTSTTYAQGGLFDGGPSVINRPWSPHAKAAVLGAGGGAILGAMLSRNPSGGALIGAILGGGAGYLYGKDQERRFDGGYAGDRYYGDHDHDRDYRNREYRDRDDRPAYNSYHEADGGYRRYN